MRTARIVVVVAILGSSLLSAAPHARGASADTFAVVCNTTQSWSFSPWLTQTTRTGTTSQSYSNGVCAQGGVFVDSSPIWPLPVSEYANAYQSPWTYTTGGGYFGDCVLAFVDVGFWGNLGLLVGGTVLLGDPTTFGADNVFGELYVLTPLLPCSESGAIGAGPAFGLGASAGL
jgi:hypothetical protein